MQYPERATNFGRFPDTPITLITGLAAVLLSMLTTSSVAESTPETKITRWRVYVGTYTKKDSKGIYLLEMDARTGALTNHGLAGETENPSFLAIHPQRSVLYAVNEISSFEGKEAGSISAFSIDGDSGKLRLLNRVSSGGVEPCHLVVDRAGRHVLVANYTGGSVASVVVCENGTLGEMRSFIQHTGSSVNPARQKGPHAHSINLDATNRFAIVADLGLDKFLVYRFGPDGALTPNTPPWTRAQPGAGPRHFAFHPGGRFGYGLNEIDSTVLVFSYDPDRGVLKPLQTVPTLPGDFGGNSSTAEVRVTPDGKFLYASNRGHDSIVAFQIDSTTGRLTLIEHEPTQGRTPRNFTPTPDGRFLLAENESTDTIVVLRINQKTGALDPIGQKITVPSPVCIRFVGLE